jgi:PAP_fibrillin
LVATDPLLLLLQGKRRTKLGLRNFISLGNFVQTIDVVSCRASNRVNFNLSGLSFLSGVLQIDASYRVAGPKRVAIDFEKACLVSWMIPAASCVMIRFC